jgi:hypothetical protein
MVRSVQHSIQYVTDFSLSDVSDVLLYRLSHSLFDIQLILAAPWLRNTVIKQHRHIFILELTVSTYYKMCSIILTLFR